MRYMPKKILIALCLLLSTIAAQSQLRYGILLGGEFTRPTGNTAAGGSGFTGGLQLEYKLPMCGLAFGTSATYQRRTINAGEKLGGDFIAVPVAVKYKFPLPIFKELAGPLLFTGPNFAWRVSDAEGKNFHLGWDVGIGIDIINFIQLTAGYRFGINNVYTPTATIRDSGWFFNAGLLFDL